MRNKTLFSILFLVINFNLFGQNTTQTDTLTLSIDSFKTRIGVYRKDSTWDIKKNIILPSQPTFVIVSIINKNPKADIVCILFEPLKVYEKIKIGKESSVNFYNLTGGDYTLTFIDNNNHHSVKINFSIEPVFWEKWWFSPFVLFVLSIVLAIIFYFIYLIQLRSKLRLQSLRHELEIKALRAQMNPHFIFNCMNTIDSYILRKRFIEASDCLQKFSKLIRQILENSENQTISIAQELETLKLYIELEQERFSDSFGYIFEIQAELLEKNYQIPPLLIQPFVENAILHGIRHLTTRKGEISIKLEANLEKNLLFCEIEDNGIGRVAAAEVNLQRQATHKSMGVAITMDRISTHQTMYGDIMQTQIIDLEEGTKIEIKLPLILN